MILSVVFNVIYRVSHMLEVLGWVDLYLGSPEKSLIPAKTPTYLTPIGHKARLLISKSTYTKDIRCMQVAFLFDFAACLANKLIPSEASPCDLLYWSNSPSVFPIRISPSLREEFDHIIISGIDSHV